MRQIRSRRQLKEPLPLRRESHEAVKDYRVIEFEDLLETSHTWGLAIFWKI